MLETRIKILSDETIAKIAAGEVVERPASVVKELIENSIDAGASRIEIELKDGGKTLIRITDDGCGMTRGEAKLSLERHSTSKIQSHDDLFAISTLGFRGEALSSIAAVSKLEILTRSRDGQSVDGTLVKVEGGKTEQVSPAGCPEGTTVKVSNLFYNTPARRKFLKSTFTELSHISNIVSKYVLACPKISFKLINNGEDLVFSGGEGSLFDAFTNVYGLDIARNAVEVNYSSGYTDIKGYVVRPTVTRVDRGHQSFFVNGRAVRNFLLSRSLEEAYRTLIPRDRHPVAALFIQIDPKEVDVNVHLTKREIRFLKTAEVLKGVAAAVSEALGIAEGEEERTLASRGISVGVAPSWKSEMADVFFGDLGTKPVEDTFKPMEPIEGELSPICQVMNTYIIATDGDGFIVLDQHAAHERVIYEEMRRKKSEERRQTLLIPENLELTQSDSIMFKENMDYLREIGFEIDEFGKNSFVVRSVPAQLVKTSAREVIVDIISEIGNFGRSTSVDERRETILKLVACHSAVRAGEPLTYEEMKSLLRRLNSSSNPSTCPHGRPTMIRFSKRDLEKMFGRT